MEIDKKSIRRALEKIASEDPEFAEEMRRRGFWALVRIILALTAISYLLIRAFNN